MGGGEEEEKEPRPESAECEKPATTSHNLKYDDGDRRKRQIGWSAAAPAASSLMLAPRINTAKANGDGVLRKDGQKKKE